MPLDPYVRRFLGTLSAGAARKTGDLTVEERRASFSRLLTLGSDPPPIESVEERQIPGPAGPLRSRLYRPSRDTPEAIPGLVFFHGGGLVAGDLETHDGICRALAAESGCAVVSVDYRLAPEARFPAALEDACAATRWVIAQTSQLGIDPARLGVGGILPGEPWPRRCARR